MARDSRLVARDSRLQLATRLAAGELATRDSRLILTIAIDERLQGAAELGWEVVFEERMQERDGGLVSFELGDAAGARGEMPLQFRMDRRRQMMLDEIGQQAHEISAAAFLSHVVRGSVRAGCSRIAAPEKTPRSRSSAVHMH